MADAVATKYRKEKSPFARAAESAPAKAKGTTFFLADHPDIKLFNVLTARVQRLEARRDEVKARLRDAADTEVFASWAKRGERPPSPVRIEDALEQPQQQVTYVFEDRTGSTPVSQQAIADLAAALELDSAPVGWTTTSVKFSFNPVVLAIRTIDPETQKRATVQEMIARRITPLLDELVKEEDLTREQADSLLTVEKKDVFVPGVLDKIASVADGDVGRLTKAIKALGSAVVRYVKPA